MRTPRQVWVASSSPGVLTWPTSDLLGDRAPRGEVRRRLVRLERVGVGVELVQDEAVLVAVDGADVEPQAARLVADRGLGVRGHPGEELLPPSGRTSICTTRLNIAVLPLARDLYATLYTARDRRRGSEDAA